jgi:hypothetical protein
VTTTLLVLVTLLVQRALGWPALPGWIAATLLPVVWVVGPALSRPERRWSYLPLWMGIGWDLLLEPVVGPGGIAWTAAAVVTGGVAAVVADRSPRAWFAFGGLGAVVVLLVRYLALLPLGLATPLSWLQLLISAGLTASWCGLVGWILALDLPARWRRHRARVLR